MPDELAVDANCLISALLGGRAREIVFSTDFALYAPQATLFEVAKHLTWLARTVGESEAEVFRKYELLPIISCQPSVYDNHLQQATELIGWRDPLDVPLLALGLARGYTIWSDDRDFQGIEGANVVTTAELLRRFEAP